MADGFQWIIYCTYEPLQSPSLIRFSQHESSERSCHRSSGRSQPHGSNTRRVPEEDYVRLNPYANQNHNQSIQWRQKKEPGFRLGMSSTPIAVRIYLHDTEASDSSGPTMHFSFAVHSRQCNLHHLHRRCAYHCLSATPCLPREPCH